MLEVLVGLIALLIGAIFCFGGNLAMRIVFPFWGFFVGFAGGAGMVAAISGDGFFGTVLGWFVGFAVGLLFAICAYLFYEVAIVIAFGSLGFTLTAALLAAIGIDWNWLVILAGTLVGVGFAIAAIVLNAPLVVLAIVTALAGAWVMVAGLLLVFNIVKLNDFTSGLVTQTVRDNWAWFIVWLALAVGGLVAQFRGMVARATLREQWDKSALPPDVYYTLTDHK